MANQKDLSQIAQEIVLAAVLCGRRSAEESAEESSPQDLSDKTLQSSLAKIFELSDSLTDEMAYLSTAIAARSLHNGLEPAAQSVERMLRRLSRQEIVHGLNGFGMLRSDLTDGGLVLTMKLLEALESLSEDTEQVPTQCPQCGRPAHPGSCSE